MKVKLADGDTIVVPELSLDKKLNQKQSSIFRGLVDHESAHIGTQILKLLM